MIAEKLEQALYEQKNRVGLVGGTVEVEEYDKMPHPVSACISPKDWKISVSYRKGFEPINDRRQKAYARVKKIEDGLETLILHVGGLHEPAHWELPVDSDRGCPYNEYWHDKITEAVRQALPDDKKQHAGYVTNAFEDTIINPRCREFNEGDFSGQVLFWDWEGLNANEGQTGYTPMYEAFVKLNMHIWGDNVDRALLKRHYTNEERIDSAVKKVVDDLGLQENIQDTRYLFNKQRWTQMAGAFARGLADLLDVSPTERLSAFDSGSGGGESGEDQEQPGNGVEQKAGTRDGKEEIAFGRYSKGEAVSTNLDRNEQLDLIYQRLARDIPVQVEAMSREQSLNIAPLTYRPFDPETDDPSRIKPSKILTGENGIDFAVPERPLTVDQKSKIQRRSFPDFKIIVGDASGTMGLAPDGTQNVGNTTTIPWGVNSRYHYFCLGKYGVDSFLRNQQIAQYIGHGLYMYSTGVRTVETRFTDAEKQLDTLFNPQFGMTNIDASALKNALRGRESFVLSISDGAIHNWAGQRDDIKELLEKNYLAHIQLMSEQDAQELDFIQDLKSWDVPISYVTSGRDLARTMVYATKKGYDRFIHPSGEQ
ncbi:MAG: hypothetical protein ABH864_03595 [archaeon]